MIYVPGQEDAALYALWRAVTPDGLIEEQGRYNLHLTPQNLSAPMFGLATDSRGSSFIELNRVNMQYVDLSVAAARQRFYAVAPASGITCGIVARWTAPLINDVIFSCLNAGPSRGLALRHSAAERLQLTGYDAAGAPWTATMAADGPFAGRTRTAVFIVRPSVSQTNVWIDGLDVVATFAGTTLPVAYDTAIAPTIGSIPGGGNYHHGRLYAVCLWPGVLDSDRITAWGAYWRDRVA